MLTENLTRMRRETLNNCSVNKFTNAISNPNKKD